MQLLLKNLLFTAVVPGTVAVYLPRLIAGDSAVASGVTLAVAVILFAIGSAIYASTVWDSAAFGMGTPARKRRHSSVRDDRLRLARAGRNGVRSAPMARLIHVAILALLLGAVPTSGIGSDISIPTKAVIAKPGAVVKLVSKSDQASFPLPAAGSPEDPTIAGAELRVFDVSPFGAGEIAFSLDRSGWRGLGTPPGSKGYVYRGKDDLLDRDPKGTCRRVVVKANTIKVVCKGATVALDPPFAGEAIVHLQLGQAPSTLRYCSAVGGTEKKNTEKGFRRVDAPAPASCPDDPAPPCGSGGFGVCPAPFFCAILPPDPTYFCAPTFCNGGTYPSCGGTCGNGWECKPASAGGGSEFCWCSPPTAQCNAVCGGFGCPGNEICTFDPANGDCGCTAGPAS